MHHLLELLNYDRLLRGHTRAQTLPQINIRALYQIESKHSLLTGYTYSLKKKSKDLICTHIPKCME